MLGGCSSLPTAEEIEAKIAGKKDGDRDLATHRLARKTETVAARLTKIEAEAEHVRSLAHIGKTLASEKMLMADLSVGLLVTDRRLCLINAH